MMTKNCKTTAAAATLAVLAMMQATNGFAPPAAMTHRLMEMESIRGLDGLGSPLSMSSSDDVSTTNAFCWMDCMTKKMKKTVYFPILFL
jgi:hypothetical protein